MCGAFPNQVTTTCIRKFKHIPVSSGMEDVTKKTWMICLLCAVNNYHFTSAVPTCSGLDIVHLIRAGLTMVSGDNIIGDFVVIISIVVSDKV